MRRAVVPRPATYSWRPSLINNFIQGSEGMLRDTELFTYAGYILLRIETNLCGNGIERSLYIHIWQAV